MRRSIVATLGAALLLSGCGFRPLYGTNSIPGGAQAAFASIEIQRISETNDSDRIGFLVGNALDELLHPPGSNVVPRYTLVTRLADERRGLAIQDDASITRYNYRLTAEWSLLPLGNTVPMATGRAETTASYNVVDQQYATLVARRDAEERTAREIAQQIRLKLAIALGGIDAPAATAVPPEKLHDTRSKEKPQNP